MFEFEVTDPELVSIHAFRGEGDSLDAFGIADPPCFNPRLPGGRRPSARRRRQASEVSIHAFRGEGDDSTGYAARKSRKFQSTPSGGKATCAARNTPLRRSVSIHAFRGEGDSAVLQSSFVAIVSIHAFRGEGDAVGREYQLTLETIVSIHAFRGEGDVPRESPSSQHAPSFNPRLPGGRRLAQAMADAYRL